MKQTCIGCGGSGQTGTFQGVSRFFITWEECRECNGTGFVEENDTPSVSDKEKEDDDENTSP